MASSLHHTTQSIHAYVPENEGIRRGWLLIVAALFLTALTSLTIRPVCRPDVPGTRETGFGIRHEQRGKRWYHCEPWIERVIGD